MRNFPSFRRQDFWAQVVSSGILPGNKGFYPESCMCPLIAPMLHRGRELIEEEDEEDNEGGAM